MANLLNMGNILTAEEAENIFASNATPEDEGIELPTQEIVEIKEDKEINSESQDTKDIPKTEEITEINPENIFGKSESVGNESEDKVEENTDESESEDSSPKHTDFYSTIAKALKEEGILQNLSTEDLESIKDDSTFKEAIEKQLSAGLTDKQRRIEEALNNGVESNVVQNYENTLNFLDNIGNDSLEDESQKGQTLRKQLIFQDYLNRGYSEDKAKRELSKSLNAGTDIQDAKDALLGNKQFFSNQYNNIIQEKKNEELNAKKRIEEEAEQLKKAIMEDAKIFDGVEVDNATRKKIYDSITAPTYKTESGEYLTQLQKYQRDNKQEFITKLGYLFVATDGFKTLDKIVKPKVTKKVNSALRELENKLNNSRRTSDGSLDLVTSVTSDPESVINKGWKLDV